MYLVRRFSLLNENDDEFSLMDIENAFLLTDPAGLGYGYDAEYQNVANTFVAGLRNIQQGQITGIANFKHYKNYRKFVDFIESANNLKFEYEIPEPDETGNLYYKKYYKDVELQNITKTQKQTNGIFSESVTFNCLSLWYDNVPISAVIDPDDTSKYNTIINTGHVPAPVEIELYAISAVQNVTINVYINDELFQSVPILVNLEKDEKLLYGTRENNFYIKIEHTDGTQEDLFDLDNISFENDNVIRLPINQECRFEIKKTSGRSNDNILVYLEYKSV